MFAPSHLINLEYCLAQTFCDVKENNLVLFSSEFSTPLHFCPQDGNGKITTDVLFFPTSSTCEKSRMPLSSNQD